MMKLITYCLNNWLRPLLFFGVVFGCFIASAFIKNRSFGKFSFLLFALGLLGLLISTIYQFLKRRWLKSIFTGFLFGGTILAFVFYAAILFFINTVDGDKWADDLKIPTKIQLNTPIDLTRDYKRPDSVLAWNKKNVTIYVGDLKKNPQSLLRNWFPQ